MVYLLHLSNIIEFTSISGGHSECMRKLYKMVVGREKSYSLKIRAITSTGLRDPGALNDIKRQLLIAEHL